MRLYIISISIVIIDQLIKGIVRANMTPHQSIPIIRKIFHISYVTNTGMAFGMFQGVNLVFLVISTLVAISIIVYERMGKIQAKGERILFGMILGGAVGNLVDRYVFGKITDFIDFRVFPVFNFADSCIFIGACILFIIYFKKKPETPIIEEQSEEIDLAEEGLKPGIPGDETDQEIP